MYTKIFKLVSFLQIFDQRCACIFLFAHACDVPRLRRSVLLIAIRIIWRKQKAQNCLSSSCCVYLQVMFTKRFLQSDAYKKAVAVGRPVFTEFGTKAFPDPCKNLFSRMMSSLVSVTCLSALEDAHCLHRVVVTVRLTPIAQCNEKATGYTTVESMFDSQQAVTVSRPALSLTHSSPVGGQGCSCASGPSSTDIKNEWSYTSTTLTYRHGDWLRTLTTCSLLSPLNICIHSLTSKLENKS